MRAVGLHRGYLALAADIRAGRRSPLADSILDRRTSESRAKLCPSCLRDLPLEAFARDRSRPLGVSSYCKECACERARVRYTVRPEERERVKMAEARKRARRRMGGPTRLQRAQRAAIDRGRRVERNGIMQRREKA